MDNPEREKTRKPPLGRCPHCDRDIPKRNLLISYESAGEWPRMFAECPTCEEPVHPR